METLIENVKCVITGTIGNLRVDIPFLDLHFFATDLDDAIKGVHEVLAHDVASIVADPELEALLETIERLPDEDEDEVKVLTPDNICTLCLGLGKWFEGWSRVHICEACEGSGKKR